MTIKRKITPFLWFNDQAEEAMNFYVSIFKNSTIESISRYGGDGPVMTGTFILDGESFMALNGGPHFTFNEAVSLFVSCETQEEIDEFWEKLSEGGSKSRCGWLKDKYGLSWQIVPAVLGELMHGKNPAKSKKVMEALMKMDKLEIAGLQSAYEQG